MTRPQIVRADTLDLQDHDQPSAQAHAQLPPIVNGSAPHQSAQLRHVQQERTSESEGLADQWGSGRSSHEGSELLDEDADLFLDNGPDPHDLRLDQVQSRQNDALADGQPGEAEQDMDEDEGDEDDGLDKISSSPSIEDEDIDFEFVYALHTFVATVEGQANATKGDTMVLLDDSNSYWWLVRVVKDSRIGYLPAEHIETPTERLARLNKHRNIDLAQSMLGDTPERSKNPLKKAMRRRNAKLVQFTTPTYFDPPENEWSDDEQDEDSGDITLAEQHEVAANSDEQQDDKDADAIGPEETQASATTPTAASTAATAIAAEESDQPHDAEAVVQNATVDGADESVGDDAAERKTRNGTIRNTDSFFKDDTVEPRKISLTPNLLREDNNDNNNNKNPRSSDSKDSTASSTSQENIFDTLDRSNSTSTSSSEKSKDKTKKEKKSSGMLSGLFKRKDKKIKVDEAAGGVVTKEGAADVPMSPSALNAAPMSPTLASPTSPVAPVQAPVKKGPNKLAKAPPSAVTTTATSMKKSSSNNSLRDVKDDEKTTTATTTATTAKQQTQLQPQPLSLRIPDGEELQLQQQQKRDGGLLSPLSSLVNSSDQPKKEKLKKAKTRIELDVDSSPEPEEKPTNPFSRNLAGAASGPSPDRPPPLAPSAPLAAAPLSTAAAAPQLAPSAENRAVAPVEPQIPVAQAPINSTDAPKRASGGDRSARDSWDGAALRTYLDDHDTNEVKDMLVIINDHTGVVPVSHDHPVMAELGLLEQQRKLDALSAQLDGLLQGFLEKRKVTRAKAAASATTAATAA